MPDVAASRHRPAAIRSGMRLRQEDWPTAVREFARAWNSAARLCDVKEHAFSRYAWEERTTGGEVMQQTCLLALSRVALPAAPADEPAEGENVAIPPLQEDDQCLVSEPSIPTESPRRPVLRPE